jgi:hypothetical protein
MIIKVYKKSGHRVVTYKLQKCDLYMTDAMRLQNVTNVVVLLIQ